MNAKQIPTTPPGAPHPPWWRGPRGEWYVAAQFVLFALVAFGPRTLPGWHAWGPPISSFTSALGGVLFAVGAGLLIASAARIGAKLSPFPHPRDGAPLHVSGPFRLVRHPMYGGGILMALGWGLWVRGWLTLAYAAALAVFFDIKARREERGMRVTYPGYAAYERRTRKLIPFVY